MKQLAVSEKKKHPVTPSFGHNRPYWKFFQDGARCNWRLGASHSECEALIGLLWNTQALSLCDKALCSLALCVLHFSFLSFLQTHAHNLLHFLWSFQVQALGVHRGNGLSEGPQDRWLSFISSEARVLWNSGWDERVLCPSFSLRAPRDSEEGLMQVFTSLSNSGSCWLTSRDVYN